MAGLSYNKRAKTVLKHLIQGIKKYFPFRVRYNNTVLYNNKLYLQLRH